MQLHLWNVAGVAGVGVHRRGNGRAPVSGGGLLAAIGSERGWWLGRAAQELRRQRLQGARAKYSFANGLGINGTDGDRGQQRQRASRNSIPARLAASGRRMGGRVLDGNRLPESLLPEISPLRRLFPAAG